ncbi:valine--tRNA ligase, partial [bacterium]|nr:valine--tRNA ligase [candidate division CSSED10-310 bacterium]
AVHPEDERFKQLIGKEVILPLQNRKIPVVADEMVDREFGTGAVKITPAHDPNDFEAGKRHDLESITVIDDRGFMNANAGSAYKNLDRFECRKRVVADLEKLDLLVSIEDYTNAIGTCYRCDSIVEPYLSKQWFVNMKPLAKPALEVVKDGKITFYPDRWTKVYLNWMENIRDWCISRQLWWGHRIPVWTCSDCGHFAAYRVDPTVCEKCGSSHLVQDPDVLDTWFSSWLWPFSTLGWPESTEDLDLYYPTSTLITAPEIIFFWVARMIMAGMEFMKEIPFSRVYLHGTVRDAIGRKMSKSLGNSPDPLDIIAKYGADALRFGMVMISPRGSDIFFSEDSLNVGRTFNNKIWNVARFVISNCPERPKAPYPSNLTLFDKWILYRMALAVQDITEGLEQFKFNESAIAIHRFIWHEFCDWYVEIAKLDIYNETKAASRKSDVERILINTLAHAIQLLHPFSPFITEEIWNQLYTDNGSIMNSEWPDLGDFLNFKEDAQKAEIIQRTVTSIRTMRSEIHIPPATEIHVVLGITDLSIGELHEQQKDIIEHLCRVKKLDISERPEPPQIRATSLTDDGVDVYIDLKDVVDVPMEVTRLKKEIAKNDQEIEKVTQKLNNEKFIANAPNEIVEKNRAIHTELSDKKLKLTRALIMLGEIQQ